MMWMLFCWGEMGSGPPAPMLRSGSARRSNSQRRGLGRYWDVEVLDPECQAFSRLYFQI